MSRKRETRTKKYLSARVKLLNLTFGRCVIVKDENAQRPQYYTGDNSTEGKAWSSVLREAVLYKNYLVAVRAMVDLQFDFDVDDILR
jgi:hypothetical protein